MQPQPNKPFCVRFDRACAEAHPTKPFLIVDGKTTTYAELLDAIARNYALFAAKGIKTGDRIGVLSRDPREVSTLLLAGLRSGKAVINVNTEFNPAEQRRALQAADVAHVFLDQGFLDEGSLPAGMPFTQITRSKGAGRSGLIGRLLRQQPRDETPNSLQNERNVLAPAHPPDAIADETAGLLLFTSGTTDAPKVVQLSHANLAAQLAIFDRVYDYDAESRIFNPLPLHFTDGLLHGPIATLLAGATLLRPERFVVQDMDGYLHGIYRDRVTHFIVVPAILSILDRLHEDYREVFRTPDFRYIRSSGDRLPERLWRSIQERFQVKLCNSYGLSETVCEALFAGPDDASLRVGTVGKPVGCSVRIVDSNGKEVPLGEPGELQIRGEIVMQGYLNQPELTADAIRDGWFSTGDLAVIEPDGFVRIVGRKKTLIISGGINIQPQDIDDALAAHPAVAESVTFGLPDPTWGEMVATAVVLRPDAAAVDRNDLVEHCRHMLAPQKVPRVLKILIALPRNPAGKVLVGDLQQQFDSDHRINRVRAGTNLDNQVINLAAEVFGCDPGELRLTSDQRTTESWDSFAHVNLMLAVEETFGIRLSPRDILSISRLQHLRELLAERIEGNRAPDATDELD